MPRADSRLTTRPIPTNSPCRSPVRFRDRPVWLFSILTECETSVRPCFRFLDGSKDPDFACSVDGRPSTLSTMPFDEFRDSLLHDNPPKGLSHGLTALWWDGKGDWTKAHESAQQDEGPAGAWVHA